MAMASPELFVWHLPAMVPLATQMDGSLRSVLLCLLLHLHLLQLHHCGCGLDVAADPLATSSETTEKNIPPVVDRLLRAGLAGHPCLLPLGLGLGLWDLR